MTLMIEHPGTHTAVREWITAILENKKWSGTDLARRAELAPSTVLRILNDPEHRFVPALKTLQKLANAANYPIPQDVLQAVGITTAAPTNTLEEGGRKRQGQVATVAPTAAPAKVEKRLPVRQVSSLPAAIARTLLPDSTMTVPCPPQLETDSSAFAFYAPDNSMEPYLKATNLIYATRRRDPAVGDLVLVTDTDGRSRVRAVKDMDASGLKLERPGPFGDDEEIGFGDIETIAIVAMISKL